MFGRGYDEHRVMLEFSWGLVNGSLYFKEIIRAQSMETANL